MILLAAAVAIAVIRSGAQHGSLDPRSADPYGSRAAAELLGDRGVSTRVVTTLDEARSAGRRRHHSPRRRPGPADRPSAGRPPRGDQELRRPHDPDRPRLALPRHPRPRSHRRSRDQLPLDALPQLRPARRPPRGQRRHRRHPLQHQRPRRRCLLPSDGLPTPPRIPAATGNGDTVVLGAPDILYNNRLRAGQRLARPPTARFPPPLGLVPPLPLRHLGHRRGKKTFLDLLPSGGSGILPALHRGRPGRPVAGTPTRPPRTRTPPRRDPRLRNRRGPRPPLPQGQRPRPRGHRSSLHHPHPTRPPHRRIPLSQAHAPEALLPARPPASTATDRPTPSSSGRRPATTLISLADQLDALKEVRRP